MNVNRRTWTLLIVAVAVIGGVYAITLWQRARETTRLLEELQVADHAVAAQAMTALRDRVGSVEEQLLQFAQQQGAPVRWRAIELLAHADGDASREAMIQALNASEPAVQAAAAQALAERGIIGAADQVAMLATNEEQPMQVRLAAVRALQVFETGTHLAEMSRLATDRGDPPPEEPEETEEEAAEAGQSPEEAGTDAETDADAEAEETATGAEEPAEEEEEEWSDDTADLRVEAVRAVAVLGAARARAGAGTDAEQRPMQAIAVLVEASSPEEHSDDVRQAACYALADLARLAPTDEVRTRAIEALLAASDDEVGDVRIAAIHGLTTLPIPTDLAEAVNAAMEDALEDEHYWVRVAAGEEPIGG